jgi:hypothetical protein
VTTDNPRRHTGLNSYLLRNQASEFIYSSDTGLRGLDRNSAQSWLWTPEQVNAEVAAIAAKIPFAGQLMAVRARP